jgi:hypothetical protein
VLETTPVSTSDECRILCAAKLLESWAKSSYAQVSHAHIAFNMRGYTMSFACRSVGLSSCQELTSCRFQWLCLYVQEQLLALALARARELLDDYGLPMPDDAGLATAAPSPATSAASAAAAPAPGKQRSSGQQAGAAASVGAGAHITRAPWRMQLNLTLDTVALRAAFSHVPLWQVVPPPPPRFSPLLLSFPSTELA